MPCIEPISYLLTLSDGQLVLSWGGGGGGGFHLKIVELHRLDHARY